MWVWWVVGRRRCSGPKCLQKTGIADEDEHDEPDADADAEDDEDEDIEDDDGVGDDVADAAVAVVGTIARRIVWEAAAAGPTNLLRRLGNCCCCC